MAKKIAIPKKHRTIRIEEELYTYIVKKQVGPDKNISNTIRRLVGLKVLGAEQ